MNLRPATPLSILFLAAFVLLLLSTLSTPIIKAIPLATYAGVDYGVFGYCRGSDCSSMGVGYTTESGLFSSSSDGEFDLPSGARHTLSAILIVHPVAAFLALVCFILSVAAHFHAPSHSSRYLMGLLILAFPTLLVALLAFLVDILLFVPHMQWGGWIVLAATIIIFCSGLVTCAMRRTLVSRKARKKRIAENSEMNGENYYNSRPPPPDMMPDTMPDTLPRADSPPPLTNVPLSPHMADKGPEFATFDFQKKSMDDNAPLNPRSQSMRSASTSGGRSFPEDPRYFADQPPLPMRAGGRGIGPSRDQYGNPLPSNGPPMRGGMAPMRGGGAPPSYGRGRGGFPPRGGPRGGFRGPRGPPPGWAGNGRGMGPGAVPMGMVGGGMMGRGQRPPPPGYGGYNGFYGGPPAQDPSPYGPAREVSPEGAMQLGVLPEPNSPIGQAIEMDGRAGTPGSSGPPGPSHYGLRDSDGELQGMVGLQQGRYDGSRLVPPSRINSTSPLSPTSVYSQDTNGFTGPHPHWINHQSAVPPPLYRDSSDNTMPSSASRGLSPIAASPTGSPVELPAQLAKTPEGSHYDGHQSEPAPTSPGPVSRTVTNTSDSYYEDIEPRFAEPTHPLPPIPRPSAEESNRPSIAASSVALPSSLVPGFATSRGVSPAPRSQNPSPAPIPASSNPMHSGIPMSSSQHSLAHVGEEDDLAVPDGARSPAASDTSHFTSISQRGVNPNWRPPPGQGGFAGPPMRPRQQDVLLEANPDFGLPGLGPPTRGGRRGGLRSGPGMRGRGGGSQGIGSVPVGRYPVPDSIN